MCETPVYNKRQILVARVGANAGFVHLADGSYDVSDNTIIIDEWCKNNVNLSSFASVDMNKLKEYKVRIPPLSEQQRIVDILDRFDALVNDLSAGLPAEIEARRKQYEYYRDTLLTFKRKAE